MAVGRRDGRAGPDVLRRVGEASVLVLISLADAPASSSGPARSTARWTGSSGSA
jgi:hypothetical protein